MLPLFEIFTQLVGGSLIFWPLLNSMAIIALFLYWVFFVPKRKPTKKLSFYLFCFFASLYLLKIIGTIYSDDLKTAGFKLQQSSALLVLPMIYAFSNPGEKVVRRTFEFFTICCISGILIGLGNGIINLVKSGSYHSLQGYNLVVLKGMAPYVFGLCCLTCMSWQILQLRRMIGQPGDYLWLRITTLAIFSLFLLFMGNRLCILLLFLLILVSLVRTNFHRAYKIAAICVIASMLFVIGMITPKLREQWNDIRTISKQQVIQLDQDSSLGRSWGGGTLRLAIWQCAADVIMANPLFGVGTGDAQNDLQSSYERRKFYFASRYNKYNAHNQYLQQWITHGLPGLLLLLGCIICGMLQAFRSGSELALFFWLCFAIACCTESMLEINKGIIWFSFLGGLICFSGVGTREVNAKPQQG